MKSECKAVRIALNFLLREKVKGLEMEADMTWWTTIGTNYKRDMSNSDSEHETEQT